MGQSGGVAPAPYDQEIPEQVCLVVAPAPYDQEIPMGQSGGGPSAL